MKSLSPILIFLEINSLERNSLTLLSLITGVLFFKYTQQGAHNSNSPLSLHTATHFTYFNSNTST